MIDLADYKKQLDAIPQERIDALVKEMEEESLKRYYESPQVKEFYECIKKWGDEVGHFSNPTVLIANRHFLRIIGIGRYLYEVVMKELPDNWFLCHVLEAWSGITPPEKYFTPKELIEWWQDYFKNEDNITLLFEQDAVMY